mgnify:CR=1 FL=1
MQQLGAEHAGVAIADIERLADDFDGGAASDDGFQYRAGPREHVVATARSLCGYVGADGLYTGIESDYRVVRHLPGLPLVPVHPRIDRKGAIQLKAIVKR